MLYKLLQQTNSTRIAPAVLTLWDSGPLRQRIRALGIPVYSLRMQPRTPSPAALSRLMRIVRRVQPDVIQGWLIQGNVTAFAAGLVQIGMRHRAPVVWNCRVCLNSMADAPLSWVMAYKFSAQLSRFATTIIYASKTSAQQHQEIGYPHDRAVFIPNGFDPTVFAPSPQARAEVRHELQLADDALLIGLIGRYHAMKDHPNFLQAAALVKQSHPHARFVLAGRGIDWQNEALAALIREQNLQESIHLLGERHDMPRLSAALDIACCSSYDEAFPNVIGEAMSCGVPCAVTDVSDLEWIVGDSGRVVPPRNARALAEAISELIETGAAGRQQLGAAARARVLEVFALSTVTAQYQALYEKLNESRNAS